MIRAFLRWKRGSLVTAFAATAVVAMITPALVAAQDARLLPSITPGQATTGSPPAPPWSGQSGGSGHPLMTADAILAAAANFSRCIEEMWPLAARRGVSRQSFDTHTAGLEPDLRI